jgi:hypothetical protein
LTGRRPRTRRQAPASPRSHTAMWCLRI